ncbi:transcription antitermination factor NusB [Candidatus Nomurabacteria bacterium]|nr:transcription antitermination factor NusB [Candidatus Nomurabacteria bacterium]
MASNRHLGRIIALQTLYEVEFRQEVEDNSLSVNEVLERNLSRYEKAVEDKTFVYELVDGILERRDDLDAALQPIAPGWPISQIARIDRNILRLGLFELLHRQEIVPPKVVINEAVELAKSFGSDNSSKFINGVLGTALRTLVEGEEPDAEAAKA